MGSCTAGWLPHHDDVAGERHQLVAQAGLGAGRERAGHEDLHAVLHALSLTQESARARPTDRRRVGLPGERSMHALTVFVVFWLFFSQLFKRLLAVIFLAHIFRSQ